MHDSLAPSTLTWRCDLTNADARASRIACHTLYSLAKFYLSGHRCYIWAEGTWKMSQKLNYFSRFPFNIFIISKIVSITENYLLSYSNHIYGWQTDLHTNIRWSLLWAQHANCIYEQINNNKNSVNIAAF